MRQPKGNPRNSKRDLIIGKMIFLMILAVLGQNKLSLPGYAYDYAIVAQNVPPPEEFASILKHDLKEYFSASLGKDIDIDYELLRDSPTQSGPLLPKFYAWVTVKKSDTIVESGGVRLAAIGRTRFQITQFVSEKEIKQDPFSIQYVFPLALHPAILKRAGAKNLGEAEKVDTI